MVQAIWSQLGALVRLRLVKYHLGYMGILVIYRYYEYITYIYNYVYIYV
jgi:hypothetical protein